MAIVADDHCIINTMGIRYISKSISDGYGRGQPFQLHVTYKGNYSSFGYQSEAKRDAMFDKLVEAMRPKSDQITT
jgi:hypothetical protein